MIKQKLMMFSLLLLLFALCYPESIKAQTKKDALIDSVTIFNPNRLVRLGHSHRVAIMQFIKVGKYLVQVNTVTNTATPFGYYLRVKVVGRWFNARSAKYYFERFTKAEYNMAKKELLPNYKEIGEPKYLRKKIVTK